MAGLQGIAGRAADLPRSYKPNPSRRNLERSTVEGESPVGERERLLL